MMESFLEVVCFGVEVFFSGFLEKGREKERRERERERNKRVIFLLCNAKLCVMVFLLFVCLFYRSHGGQKEEKQRLI